MESRSRYTFSMLSTFVPLILIGQSPTACALGLTWSNLRLDFDQHHLHHHPCMYKCLLTCPSANHPWSILWPLIPRSKPLCPPFAIGDPSRTDSLLDILHYGRSSHAQHLHIHKAKRYVAHAPHTYHTHLTKALIFSLIITHHSQHGHISNHMFADCYAWSRMYRVHFKLWSKRYFYF